MPTVPQPTGAGDVTVPATPVKWCRCGHPATAHEERGCLSCRCLKFRPKRRTAAQMTPEERQASRDRRV